MRKFKLLVVALVGVLFLAACGGGAGAAGNNELIFAVMSDAPTLDIHGSNDSASSDAQHQIFETLTKYNEDGSVAPLLAESFDNISDTVWEFNLRQGITFHDGSELNADVVVANFTRLLDPEFASPKAFIFETVDSVEAVDNYTVRFTLTQPFAPFPAHLAHSGGMIASLDSLAAGVEDNPIGTGPFKFYSWERGNEIRFVRNEDHWQNVPNIESLVFRVIPEPETRFAMLEAGEAQVTALDAVRYNNAVNVPDINIDRLSSTSLTYLGFNTETEPFNDVRVRRAVTMAINKDDILHAVVQGLGVTATGPIAPTVNHSSNNVNTIQHNVEEARALLAEAGLADGFETVIYYNEGNAGRATIAELVQANLRELNIDVQIRSVEWGQYLELTGAGETPMFILGWGTVTADADYGIFPVFHSSLHGDAGNRSFYSNPRVDELLEQGRLETDEAARSEIYREVKQLIIDDAPVVFLFHPDWAYGTNGITGFSHNFNNVPFFYNVSFE